MSFAQGIRSAAAFTAALSFSAAGAAFAADEMPRKAEACVVCHGSGGNSSVPTTPSIAGHPAQAITMQLYQFREGNRKDPQMSPMASTLTNAEMRELGAYFAKQKPAAPLHTTVPENAAVGARLAAQYHCVQCHGPQLLGQQHIPRLAGQQYEYLKTQLRGFKARTRSDLDGNMSSAAQDLSDKDIEVLVDWIAGLAPQ